MSIQLKCNICGGIEGIKNTTFTTDTYKLKIPGHDGKMYCLDLYIDIIYEKDLKKINDFKRKQLESPEAFLKQLVGGKNNVQAEMQKIPIDEPYPSICDTCKEKLSYLIIQGGMSKGYNEF